MLPALMVVVLLKAVVLPRQKLAALKLTTGCGQIVTLFVLVDTQPLSLVAVRLTTYTPLAVYVFTGFMSAEVLPLPKFQL